MRIVYIYCIKNYHVTSYKGCPFNRKLGIAPRSKLSLTESENEINATFPWRVIVGSVALKGTRNVSCFKEILHFKSIALKEIVNNCTYTSV